MDASQKSSGGFTLKKPHLILITFLIITLVVYFVPSASKIGYPFFLMANFVQGIFEVVATVILGFQIKALTLYSNGEFLLEKLGDISAEQQGYISLLTLILPLFLASIFFFLSTKGPLARL